MKKASSVKTIVESQAASASAAASSPTSKSFCASRIGCGIGRACLSVVRRIYEWVFKQFLHA